MSDISLCVESRKCRSQSLFTQRMDGRIFGVDQHAIDPHGRVERFQNFTVDGKLGLVGERIVSSLAGGTRFVL